MKPPKYRRRTPMEKPKARWEELEALEDDIEETLHLVSLFNEKANISLPEPVITVLMFNALFSEVRSIRRRIEMPIIVGPAYAPKESSNEMAR
jgi:hypothetical protein